MQDTFPEPNETAESTEVGREELALAVEVMQSMVKTSKALKMYLPNNPLVARFVEEAMAKIGRHLALYGEFKIDIDQFELKYKGKTIYDVREPKESLSFKMYIDGIRYLIFSEGIMEHELCDFLDIVGKDRPSDVDDDIVTLLWEKNLPHLTYILAEDFLEFDALGGGVGGAVSQQDKISGIYQSIAATTAAPTLSIVPQNILVLSDEETDWLKRAKAADDSSKPLDEVIKILTSILIGENDLAVFSEFMEIMVKLTGNLFKSEDPRYPLSLVKFLENMGNSPQTPPGKKEIIGRSLEEIFSKETAEVIAGLINKSELYTPEDLAALLKAFGKPALARMCEMLGLVDKMKMRKVILQALIEIGHDCPEVFVPFLSDPRWYVVRNMAFILARISNPASLEPVTALISHREAQVRKEVLHYLERSAEPKARPYLLKFLRDDATALRIRALQVLGGTRSGFALKPILAMVSSEQFQEKDFDERKAAYEALGEIGQDQILPKLQEMMVRKYWFNKAKEKESLLLAVAGIMKVQSAQALELLEEMRLAKGDEMREIISEAIAAKLAVNPKGAV